ncbi:MAG: triose-phosphate isomerase [Myxococcales bacterium]|nr:triose-phosphate isomerase [Myxococcales bacterium]
MKRRPLVIGNWKMNGDRAAAVRLAAAAADVAAALSGVVDVGISPPAVWLERAAAVAGSARVLAQTSSEHTGGAHTGELSCAMLSEAGATGTLVGHSERRQFNGEDDAVVASKLREARESGLEVVLCVGESLEARDAGATLDVVEGQLEGALGALDQLAGIVIAYEPVWAIGTGRTATPEQAQEVHAAVRSWLARRFGEAAAAATRILYGGSVKGSNAAALLSCADIDGALVGGASLDAAEFAAICRAAAA